MPTNTSTTITVTVRLFAAYREAVGKVELPLDMPSNATVGDLAREMVKRYPSLPRDPKRLVVAVNQEYRDHNHALRDGDEVALIPPVSGGCIGTTPHPMPAFRAGIGLSRKGRGGVGTPPLPRWERSQLYRGLATLMSEPVPTKSGQG